MSTELETKLVEKIEKLTPQSNDLEKFFQFLVESEQQAIALYEYAKNPSGPPPVIPKKGSIECGFLLYWIKNPPTEVLHWIEQHKIVKAIWKILQILAPQPKLTTAEYNFIVKAVETSAIPWIDGTLIGEAKYEQLDKGWILAGINYAINLIDPDLVYQPFPATTPPTFNLTAKSGSGDPVLAIIGDWGTGFYQDNADIDCPAQRVINSLPDSIDYLVHLGDVYYAGTDWRPLPGEELLNFVTLWPDQGAQRNFTLNSNHEMYGGANGYFDVALKADIFKHQQGKSRFHMTYGPWLILGLDSAYYSDAENGHKFYMDGALGTAQAQSQLEWLQGFANHDGPIMLMSHHNPCDTNTAQLNMLYGQVKTALGREPDVWYWGHVHNGIVYENLFADTKGRTVSTKGRCCGHASIPFGNGWGLEGNKNISYYAHTPDPLQPKNSPRVLNGYALVTPHLDGSFTEAFYETENLTPVYQKKWPVSSCM